MYKLLFLFFIPSLSFADCPNLFEVNDSEYCLELLWENGEKKLKGQFKETSTTTPHLNAMGEIPQKWIYSQTKIHVWKKSDSKQKSVVIPGFKVFPFMVMSHGMNHSTGFDFFYDFSEQVYILRRMAFQKMLGCWSLRWTTGHDETMKSSNHLTNLVDFQNLNKKQVEKQIDLCDSTQTEFEQLNGGHDHTSH